MRVISLETFLAVDYVDIWWEVILYVDGVRNFLFQTDDVEELAMYVRNYVIRYAHPHPIVFTQDAGNRYFALMEV